MNPLATSWPSLLAADGRPLCFASLNISPNRGVSFNKGRFFLRVACYPSFTAASGGPPSPLGRLPFGFLVIPLPSFSPYGEKSTFPSGKANPPGYLFAAGAGALSAKHEEIPLGYPRPTVNLLLLGNGQDRSLQLATWPLSPLGRLNGTPKGRAQT